MDYIDKSFQAVSKAIYFFSSKGKNICLPMKHIYAYDFILVGHEDELLKIKVVQTESRAESGVYVVNLRRSCGYDSSKEVKAPFDPYMCDILFVISPMGWYMIPTEEITQKRAISLSMFEKFKLEGIPG